jgi:methionyl-tRNA formyltransferase
VKKFLIISTSDYFKNKIKKKNFFFINSKKKFSIKKIKSIDPQIIFIPHWNWKIDKKILKKYLCIGFHSTPLPYGRGGSPIQNMIERGHKKSVVCAIKINNKLDSGDVYLRKKFLLKNSAHEIFENIYNIIIKMIYKLEKKLPNSKPQKGRVIYFKRRKSSQSNISNLNNLNKIYDYIRMLDTNVKDFPLAFANTSKLKIEFKNANFKKKFILAQAKIKLR